MTSSLRKLSQQLQGLARHPRELAALLTRLGQRDQAGLTGLQEAEQAIALVTADEARHALAGFLYRWLDTQRVWMGDGVLPRADTSVYTACVPFTLEDLTLAKDGDALRELTGPIDHLFSAHVGDALFPGHKNYVLAVPLVGIRLVERWAVNFMLANSHRDTPVDNVYGEMWANFLRLKHEPRQAVFGYLFSLAVPGRPPSRPPGPVADPLPMTPWAQHATDVLMRHAQDLNTRHPRLGLRLHAMTTLSQAVEMASELRFKSMFEGYRSQVGQRGVDISPDAQRLSGLSDEAVERIVQQRREDVQSNPVPDEVLYGKVALGSITSVVQDNGVEFLHANMFTQSGQLTLSVSVQVPLGSRPQDALRWWRHLDQRGLAEVVALPTEHVSDFQQMLLGKVRDTRGQWVERELLNWGADALTLFRTAKWSTAFGSETPGGMADSDRQRAPVTETFEQLGLAKVLSAHYTPAVAEAARRLLASPGMSRRAAFQCLVEQFPALQRFSLLDAFNAFIPPGMWAALHHEQSRGVLFRVDPTVQEQMALTDVDKRFPLEFLHCPFPDIYLHLEQRVMFELPELPRHWLDGAYVSERKLNDAELAQMGYEPGTREVTLTMVLNDEGSVVSLDYPVVSLFIHPNDERDLAVMLAEAAERTARKHGPQGAPEHEQVKRTARHAVLSPLLEVCKLLLYISFPEARLQREFKKTELLTQARQLSGRDRQRMLDRAAREHDRILVGPIAPMATLDEDTSPGEGRSVKPHPRRGYVRSQPWGERNQLRRPKWIPPVMVNKHRLTAADAPAPAKTYKVT